MRLLVTGGSGFIGSNFIRYWLAGHDGDEVTNLDALTYAGDPRSLADVEAGYGPRYHFARGDIAERTIVESLIRERPPDLIVNFAAETHNSRAVIDPTAFTRTNVAGTHTLLEAARLAGVPRFHHISTCEVYGDLALESDQRFTESSPYRPRTPYNASKAAADLMVRAYHETYGMAVTISNCSNNYGPYQHPEKMIPLFATNAIDDRPLPLYRQSANRREWLHVDDHCRAIELVLERGKPGETYNVGSGEERSIEEIADAVLSLLDKPSSLKSYVEDRPGHDRRYLLDHTKIEHELGWRARIAFADGLASTVRWYVGHRDWWAQKKDRLGTELDEFAWRR
ncbi:MAG TPA: dTDP-glucose 4,6-dehydratase [Candidatus Limnocylindria bacterium]|nr:dTDP-glucose 4,6-dehydratase [Candidatus Limnocylindria bacterium]